MEFMKVLFDSQSCWEAVSALGTIMASGIALWLARRDHAKNMSALLVLDRVFVLFEKNRKEAEPWTKTLIWK